MQSEKRPHEADSQPHEVVSALVSGFPVLISKLQRRVAMFYMVNNVALELQFACKILYLEINVHCNLSIAKVFYEIVRGLFIIKVKR